MSIINETLLRALVGVQGLQQGLKARFTDEDGQTLAEYGLIMAVIAIAVVVAAVVAFRGAITGAFDSATGCLDGTDCAF